MPNGRRCWPALRNIACLGVIAKKAPGRGAGNAPVSRFCRAFRDEGVSLWSSAHAAKSLAQSVFGFTVRRGWGAERERQAAPAVPKPPSPSHRALGCEPLVLALDDQHELDGRPQYDSIASRGVGGTKGRARARPSTARGKMGGNALFKRRTDR